MERETIKAVSKQISMSKGPESIPQLSTNTTRQSSHPPPSLQPSLPFSPFLWLFPFFFLHFLLHSTLVPLLSLSPLMFSFPLSQLADGWREGAGFIKRDGWMYRQRKTGREGEVDSHQVGMGGLFCWTGGYERERGPLPPSLCWGRQNKPLAKKSRGNRDEEAGMEVGREKRQKTWEKLCGKRFCSSLATMLFLYLIHQLTTAWKSLWSDAICHWLQRDCMCVCVNHYLF